MSIRRTALETLTEITEKGAYANLTLKEALRGLEERDAKWVSAAVYTTLGHLLYIDHVIAAYTPSLRYAAYCASEYVRFCIWGCRTAPRATRA